MIPEQPTTPTAPRSKLVFPAPSSSAEESVGSSGNKKLILIGAAIFIVLVLIVALALFFFTRSSSKSKDVTLLYWGVWEEGSVFSEVFVDFEREHPNVKIKYEKQDIKTVGKYIERIRTRINNGSGPDIMRVHSSWIFQLKDFLQPFPSDVVSETQLEDKYYDVTKKDLVLRGAYYGLPLGIDTLALFINTELFEAAGMEAPATWDDLFNAARHLTVKDETTGEIKTSGAAFGTYNNIAHASDILSLLFIQNGADLKNLTGPTRINAEQALDYYTCFAKQSEVCEKVWDENLENSKLAFAKGNVAMYFGYSWDIFEIQALNKDLKFKVVPVPRVAGTEPESIASYWVEAVSVKSKGSAAAFELIKFLSKPETLQKLYTAQAKLRGFGEPYPRSDMAELLKNNTLIFPFVEQAKNASSTLFPSDTYDDNIVTALNQAVANAIGSALLNTSSASAIDTLAKEIDRYY